MEKILYTKDFPYLAKIKEKYRLSHSSSSKETHHIVIDIKGSGIEYSVGDVVAVYPTHQKQLVDETLKRLNVSGDIPITCKRTEQVFSLKDFLTYKANITDPTKKMLQEVANRQPQQEKKEQLLRLFEKESRDELKTYLSHHLIWHVLEDHPEVTFEPQKFCDLLSPLLPRFYSIASSPFLSPDEIHLTVAVVNYPTKRGSRPGVCSHYLCSLNDSLATEVPIYLQPHKGFTLPQDPSAPMIMVGPGTGIAPFRAFLQERIASKAPGKNWLFFGERNRSKDFLYEKEWEAYIRDGKLRLETAFSRDQEQKVYVQHKLIDHAKEVYQWLQEGAYFYVCGDAKAMARDVEQALLHILENEGNMSSEAARQWIKDLRKQNRYLRDIY